MTLGYAEWLEGQGVHLSSSRPWPLEWINFRLHPCAHRPGIEEYRRRMREGDTTIEPVILCSKCLVVLDGWHRVAAAWREGLETVSVRFADQHWQGKDRCYVELTTWIESLAPWKELDCVSGAYLAKDFEHPLFAAQVKELVDFGDNMPKVRLWEHARALIFLGNVRGKQVLDIGTRESLVPFYLKTKGARVTILEKNVSSLDPSVLLQRGILWQEGSITDAPFDDDLFDAVLCTAVLKHIPSWGDRRAMQEMVRITRPGGLIAVSFDFAPQYYPYGTGVTGKRIYDVETVMSRLVRPVSKQAEVAEPLMLSRADWNDWPIKYQSEKVYKTGVNVQVAFLLFIKKGGPCVESD